MGKPYAYMDVEQRRAYDKAESAREQAEYEAGLTRDLAERAERTADEARRTLKLEMAAAQEQRSELQDELDAAIGELADAHQFIKDRGAWLDYRAQYPA